MTKKPDTTIILAAAAVTTAVGIASYMFFKTYKTINKLDELELDFGNDDALLSAFVLNKMKDL
jgi:hypothetical protein